MPAANAGAMRAPAAPAAQNTSGTVYTATAQNAVLNPMKLQSSPRPVAVENAAEIITDILTKAW